MARNIGADGRTVYRARITRTRPDSQPSTWHEGPYGSVGAARARVSFWRNYLGRSGSEVTGEAEQAHTVWTAVGEQPPVDQAARAQAYRDAADDIDAEYTGPGADRAARYAAAFLRRRADQIQPAAEEPTP
ncbi:hypothetical protein [Streptomyces sp. NPDC059631]|uniref:hypothetical protein n=1 Tax=unclassified Streptomyces TaxID=2593676 RepID=UPI0036822B05